MFKLFGSMKPNHQNIENQTSDSSTTVNELEDQISELENQLLEHNRINQQATDQIIELKQSIAKKDAIIESYKNKLNTPIDATIREKEQELEKLKEIRSSEKSMSKQFKDKAQSLIHEQSNNCKSLAGSFTHMMKFMGKNPFHLLKDSSTDAFQKIFTPYIDDFKSSFITLMNSISENRSSRNISEDDWTKLSRCKKQMLDLNDVDPAISIVQYREISAEILNIVTQPEVKLSKSLRNSFAVNANDLTMLVCLYDVQTAFFRIEKIYNQLISLVKEFDASQIDEKDSNASVLNIVIKDLFEKYTEIATAKHIDIRRNPIPQIKVSIPEDELTKVIQHILNNAIQYTGTLPENSKYDRPWVQVYIRPHNQHVTISFESWGIPLTTTEYENKLMFNQYFRGSFVLKKNISGSGEGLYFARQIARKYHGDITYETRPVSQNLLVYKPVKTTVTLTLPITKMDFFSYDILNEK